MRSYEIRVTGVPIRKPSEAQIHRKEGHMLILCIKWTTTENLLYSSENSMQCAVVP